MRPEELKRNVTIYGPLFPEPVQIILSIPMGSSVRLVGKGVKSNTVYEPILSADQLEQLRASPAEEPFDGDATKFRLGVEAMRLGLAYEYDPYFSLSIARVDPLPHQLEAVYDYFIKLPRIRFLLADDPGAGKTIMAGLLIKELKIRGLVKRTLIVTPANLSFQWQRELKDKFRENFEVVRSDVLRANYGMNPWQEKNQVITSVSWVSRIEDAKESLLRSQWDLIIVDEAHKMSAYSDDKKTLAYRLGESLSGMTDHYLLMTATPHKGDPENFRLFLSLLDKDVYGDIKSLDEAMARHEAPFYLRRLKEALVSFPDPDTGIVKALFEAAVTTDICGKKDSHAVRLDNEAVDAIKKSRLHRMVATTIFFESNGGMARAEATAPEVRLAVAEPDLDIGHVETVLDALTDACYYLTVERNRYHFSFKENLNKRYADRRANIKDDTISERVRAEVQTVFATSNGIAPVFFPENSGKVPDKPALTFVVLTPEQSMEDEKRVKAFIDGVIREHGSSSRTYKSGLVFVVANSTSPLYESARRVLAWEEIERELPGISVDKTQITQLDENIKKSRRDLKEGVWRCYNNIALLGKNNEVRSIDLGNMHSSAAASIIQFIVNELMHVDEIQTGIGPNLLVRNWPPAIPEWNTRAVRDAFFASPLFPRLLNADAVKETIARGVSNGQLAYVGKTGSGKYHPFNFKRSITAFDVEISEEMYIITKENAEAYEQAASQPPTHTQAPTPALFPPDSFPGNPPRPSSEQPTTASKPTSVPGGPESTQLMLGLTWSGDVPSQKWMNFYTKVITKLGVGNDLSLNVKVKCKPQGGVSKQKIEEIKSALRELGLDDNFEE